MAQIISFPRPFRQPVEVVRPASLVAQFTCVECGLSSSFAPRSGRCPACLTPIPAPPPLAAAIDALAPGQALTIRAPHRTTYAEFVGHAGERMILCRKLISSMYRARWTKPLPVARADVLRVHAGLARPELEG